MRRVSMWILGAVAAVSWTSVVAQIETENRTQLPARLQPAAQPSALTRPGLFAPASAASARRLTTEQRDEWRFLKDAAAATRFERDASKLALAKSTDAGVRELAQTLAEHHASAATVIDHMLHVRSMAAPMLSSEQRRTLNRLGRLQGRKFDREYLAKIAQRAQQDNLSTFERAAGAVREPSLKSWIDAMVPTMRADLASADGLAVHADSARAAISPVKPTASRIIGRNSP